MDELSKTESALLAECEAKIERVKDGFVEAGNAMLEIRDKRLYRATHPTFDDYCLERWGYKRSHSHRLIQAAEVVESLKTSECPQLGTTLNEGQARELVPVVPAKRAAVLAEASKSGPPTAATIKAAASKVPEARKPQALKDDIGRPIPRKLYALWQRKGEVQTLLTHLSKVRSTIEHAQSGEDPLYSGVNFSVLSAALDRAYDLIGVAKPFAVCPLCQGVGCKACGERGLLSKFHWDKLIPADVKKAAIEAGKK